MTPDRSRGDWRREREEDRGDWRRQQRERAPIVPVDTTIIKLNDIQINVVGSLNKINVKASGNLNRILLIGN